MKFLKQNFGFSIAEVTIAAGILGVVTLGVVKTIELTNKTNKEAQTGLESNMLVNSLSIQLMSTEFCEANLKDKPIVSTSATAKTALAKILNRDGNDLYIVGQTYGNNTITLKEAYITPDGMNLPVPAPVGSNHEGTVTLNLVLKKSDYISAKDAGGNVIERVTTQKIPIHVVAENVAGSYTIRNCHGKSAVFDEFQMCALLGGTLVDTNADGTNDKCSDLNIKGYVNSDTRFLTTHPSLTTTILGDGALANFATDGTNYSGGHTAIGANALSAHGYAWNANVNTAVGMNALHSSTTSQGQVAVGGYALNSNLSGMKNIAIGWGAGYSIRGNYNTALGGEAMYNPHNSERNTAVGFRALQGSGDPTANTDNPTENIAIGYEALTDISNGDYNVAVGSFAMKSKTNGQRAVAVGHQALENGDTSDVVAIGYRSQQAGGVNTNVSIGYQTLMNATEGENVAIGYNSQSVATTGPYNTSVGSNALARRTTGNGNTAVGSTAAYNTTTGVDNMAFGPGALEANTTGDYNIAIGAHALRTQTTASFNIGIGTHAGYNMSSGQYNSVIGYHAIEANTSGRSNSVLGASAMLRNTTGSFNVAVGALSLSQNGTGDHNVAVGYEALNSNGVINSDRTVAIGYRAGFGSDGDNNIFIGPLSGLNYNGNNRLIIGANGTELIRGDIVAGSGISVYGPVANHSDARLKTDITQIKDVLSRVLQLKGVAYHWKDGEDPIKQIGVLAQNVQKYFPELVRTEHDGYLTVNYGGLTAVLVEAIKEQQAQIDDLKAQIQEIKRMLK